MAPLFSQLAQLEFKASNLTPPSHPNINPASHRNLPNLPPQYPLNNLFPFCLIAVVLVHVVSVPPLHF